jgi:hypothetical protein
MGIIDDLKDIVTEIDIDVPALERAIIIKSQSRSNFVSRELIKDIDKAILIIKVALDRECKRNNNNKN